MSNIRNIDKRNMHFLDLVFYNEQMSEVNIPKSIDRAWCSNCFMEMFALSVTTYDIYIYIYIYPNKKNRCWKFDLENEDQGHEGVKLNFRHANVWDYIGYIFHNFSYPITYVYATAKHTRARIHLHTQREMWAIAIGNLHSRISQYLPLYASSIVIFFVIVVSSNSSMFG